VESEQWSVNSCRSEIAVVMKTTSGNARGQIVRVLRMSTDLGQIRRGHGAGEVVEWRCAWPLLVFRGIVFGGRCFCAEDRIISD
jgi:hypothetical protein